MSPRRITKRHMKEDKLVTTTFQITEYLQKHLNTILMGVGGIVVVALVLVFYISSQARKNERAADLFGQANLELQTGDLRGAILALRDVVDNYGGTKVAGQAMFFLGNAFYYMGDCTQASAAFRRYVADYKEDPLITASCYAGIAECHIEGGDNLQGAEFYLKAATASPQSFLAPMYLLSAGEAYAKTENKTKAKELFQRLIDEYPQSRWVEKAKKNLAAISVS